MYSFIRDAGIKKHICKHWAFESTSESVIGM